MMPSIRFTPENYNSSIVQDWKRRILMEYDEKDPFTDNSRKEPKAGYKGMGRVSKMTQIERKISLKFREIFSTAYQSTGFLEGVYDHKLAVLA